MELRQLEYFRRVVETGSISEAARRLHMSQPPLSYQMKKLEEEVGTLLFVRGHRNIALTEAGTILYTRAVQILSMSDAAVREAGRAGKFRTLYIGMTPSTIRIMSPYLKEFSILYPEVRYQIRDGSTFVLKHLLENGEIDVAVLRTPVPTDTMEVLRLGTDHMAAAVPAGMLESDQKPCASFTLDPDDSVPARMLESSQKMPETDAGKKRRDPSARHADTQTLLPYISLKELAALPLSVYQRYADLLTECFAGENLTPDFFSVCDDARTALLWSEEGIAAAVFPESLLGRAPVHAEGQPGPDSRNRRNSLNIPGSLNFRNSTNIPGSLNSAGIRNGPGSRSSLTSTGEEGEEEPLCRIFRINEPALQTDVLLVRDKSRAPNALVNELWTFVEGRRQAMEE